MRLAFAAPVILAACAGEPETVQDAAAVAQEAQRFIPRVEEATGLRFREEPRFAVRSREQVMQYVLARFAESLPPDQIEGITAAYQLMGLLPDSLDLRSMMLDLLMEQVAGYYDPDSSTLYVVEGADPTAVNLVVAHELVHALQDQYLPLDSIMSHVGDSDQSLAAQAILEGQATLASLQAISPGTDFASLPGIGDLIRSQIRQQREAMPEFTRAPLIIRESLIFPYLNGADFMSWFARQFPDTVPYGARMPQSSEQILFPEKYRAGEAPVELRFLGEQPLFEDELGEFPIQVMLAQLAGRIEVDPGAPLGWAGDRLAVYRVESAHGLVWWSVWDTPTARQRFFNRFEREWRARGSSERWQLDTLALGDRAALRLVVGPATWGAFAAPPAVEVR